MKINEIFYSLDGECPRAGMPTVFIRRSGCNLHCKYDGKDCDTPYRNEGVEMSVLEIMEKVKEVGGDCMNITLTGGEPLLPCTDLTLLRTTLFISGYKVNIETNGTMSTADRFSTETMVVDYKCGCSGMTSRMNKDSFKHLSSNDVIKMVVDQTDLNRAEELVNEVLSLMGATGITNGLIETERYLKTMKSLPKIYFSPCYGKVSLIELAERVKELANTFPTLQIGLSIQLHKIIWNKDTRGV